MQKLPAMKHFLTTLCLIFTLLVALPICLPAQHVVYRTSQPNLEMTEEDITTYSNFKAEQATIFGLQLGMTQEAAIELIDRNPEITYQFDRYDHRRLYIHNSSNDSSNSLMYLIWVEGDAGLKMITFFEPIQPILRGSTKKLLTDDALMQRSRLVKNFLGKPQEERVTLDIPQLDMRNVSYYFHDLGIKVTFAKDGENERVIFALYRGDIKNL